MDFLKSCATRLDDGEEAASVMRDLRERYRTVRCVNVKACLVRGMCAPTPEYLSACEELVARRPELYAMYDATTGIFSSSVDRTLICSLPRRHNENVRTFTISREEARECKRTSARNAIVKNKFAERVNGRVLLRHARFVIDTCADETAEWSIPELTFALMLVTGRRECEILNGWSTFVVHTEYSMTFHGQAKKRGSAEPLVVPVLARSTRVEAALRVLRKRQNHSRLSNVETSRRYQSYLSRYISDTAPWKQCRRVHSLRGCYACMGSYLFEWGSHSSAFVTMCILGHSGLNESLVYTPFHLGKDFGEEPSLGQGHFTEWVPPPPPEESKRDASDPLAFRGEGPTPR